MLKHNGYTGQVECDDESRALFGRVIGLRDMITFEADSGAGAIQAFRDFGVRGTPYSTLRRSLGAGFLASEDPAQVLFERCQKFLPSQWSASVLVGT
jgi:hypothetical protein